MLKGYSKILDYLEKVEKVLLSICMITMTAVVMYQVIMRYFFNNANAWSEELARYLMIFAMMVGSAIAVRRGSHLQIDVFLNKFSERTKRYFTIVSTAIGIGFLVYLTYYSIKLCQMGLLNKSAGLGFVMTIPYLALPIGCVLMILSSLEVIFKSAYELKHNKEGKEK